MKKYYFRVDGGNIYSVATGHIFRCLKFANYISGQEEAGISFIMRDFDEGVNLVKDKYSVILLDKNIDSEKEIQILKNIVEKGSYFICDLRNINEWYITQIKSKCCKFILFDDLGIRNIHPDILINPSPFCYSDYMESEYPNTILLLGEKFFFTNQSLIEKSFQRDFCKERYSIMSSFGGADPLNITEFFIQNIVPRLKKHAISVILGPANQNKQMLIRKYSNIKNITFHQNIIPLDEMFLSHDIAFVCGGDTCIEACSSGAATFIISSIYYEKNTAKLLHEKQAAFFVADAEDIKKGSFNFDGAQQLLDDKVGLKRLSENGINLIDGNGLRRIYKILWEERNERKYKRDGIYSN